jgi:S-adenosylmethionine:tRNA ribosyltransferase-isomerase
MLVSLNKEEEGEKGRRGEGGSARSGRGVNLEKGRKGEGERGRVAPMNQKLKVEREQEDKDNCTSRDIACNVSTSVALSAELIGELEGGFEVRFSWDNPNYTFAEILEAAGNIPIPPYLHRESEEIDQTVYQTVFSKIKGSVAAPTAGLHFTEQVFDSLAERQIECEELTLHVGAGTFQPVKSDTVGEHLMHTEYFSVNRSVVAKLISHPGKLIAVGTTSVRTLESLYWIGCKILQNASIGIAQLSIEQWEPYREVEGEIAPKAALQAILDWMDQRNLHHLDTATQIMILPGYQFKIISGLVTNFHQPQSTLLLLISAILGDNWKRIYQHALAGGYRFLSYGDANLYWI